MTVVEAASLPETFFTVWSNVFDRAGLKPGESFLVQGGSSGIGVTAIQMVKAFGNTVFATAGSAEKCQACVKLGADRAINYKTEDFAAVVKEATAGRGVNVILDMVGGEYLDRELKCLADDGRVVIIAFLGGAKATLLNPLPTWRRDARRIRRSLECSSGELCSWLRRRTGFKGVGPSLRAPQEVQERFDSFWVLG